MIKKNILVITDNIELLKKFEIIIHNKKLDANFDFKSTSPLMGREDIEVIDVKKNHESLYTYHIIISLHCKQLFPRELVENVKCINIHPGFNPYNRGWYPQVFSIINKLPLGATIHEMDAELDNGGIIDQVEVEITSYDTSLTSYNNVLEKEVILLEKNLENIINNNYVIKTPCIKGNLNLRKDFTYLCELDLNEVSTMGHCIDRLRALSHGEFKNAYFLSEKGEKIYVKISLECET